MNPTWLLTAGMLLSCALCGTLSAQAEPSVAPPVMVVAPGFARWQDDAHLAGTGFNTTVSRDTTRLWWGLGTGATVGAAAGLALTQAFCVDDNGCVGRSIGAILMGTLVGGALESGMDY